MSEHASVGDFVKAHGAEFIKAYGAKPIGEVLDDIANMEAKVVRLGEVARERIAALEAARDELLDVLKKAERRLADIAESDAAYSSASTLHMIRFVIAKATGEGA